MDSLTTQLERPEGAVNGLTPIEAFLGVPMPKDFILPAGDVHFFDREDMEKLMIERAPFFFIDKAVVLDQGTTVFGVATMSEERSAGHFPGRPIVPLIELCKAMAQTGMIVASFGEDPTTAPIAVSAGASKAIAKHLIDAPCRILIKVSLMRAKIRVRRPTFSTVITLVGGTTYIDGAPIGTLDDIKYVSGDRNELMTPRR